MRSIALAALLAAPTALGAQVEGAYRLLASDTLAYREVSTSSVAIQSPQGPIVAGSTHDAVIHLTSNAPGSVAAWYSALALGSSGPNGNITPSTDLLLNQAYRLLISGVGDVETLEAPPAPPEVQAMTDLAHQFQDFFIRVPSTRPEAGVTWADTIASNASGIPQTTQAHRAVRVYEAGADTLVDGRRVQRITITTTVQMESTSPMAGQPGVNVTTTLAGTDHGWALFDWEKGHLVVRAKSGELRGVLRVVGPQTVDLPQTWTYESRIEIAPGGGA